MRDWLAIVNPRSGGLANHRRLDDVTAFLRQQQAEVVRTQRPGHATELAAGATDRPGVIAVGGDGLIFEVLQGLTNPAQPLLTLPGGRGNSLTRDLGLYPFESLRPLPAIRLRSIDLLSVRYQTARSETREYLSASTIATGFAAEVAELAGRRLRRLRSLSYIAAGALCRPRLRPMTLRYNRESVAAKHFTGTLISNTQHAARFIPFPEADCADGTFEAMELSAGIFRQSIHSVSTLTRTQVLKPPVRTGLTELRLTMETPELLLLDGELFSDVVAVDVRVLPAARTCVVAA